MADRTILFYGRQKIAILIDGDNAQSSLLPQMLVEAGRHGQVTVRRIYGDWTTNSMNSWKETLELSCLPAHPAIPLYDREERHRQRHDHRRHGHPALRVWWMDFVWSPPIATTHASPRVSVKRGSS
jgi:hypothetical protein